tara:strand:+ start:569 stop:970 length:402 start_codon:yes stop_codon:yes gene_type:complete
MAGATLAKTPHFVFHCMKIKPDARMDEEVGALTYNLFKDSPVWFGALVPKRWAKRAVRRSLIRRQIYDAGVRYQGRLNEGSHVIRLRGAFNNSEFKSATSTALKESIRSELDVLFAHAIIQLDEEINKKEGKK